MMDQKKQELIQVSLTNSGAYFIFSVPNVKRGICGKTRGHADEVIIHGIPKNKLQDFCVKNEIQITNLAVYQYGEKILINISGSSDYNKTGRYTHESNFDY